MAVNIEHRTSNIERRTWVAPRSVLVGGVCLAILAAGARLWAADGDAGQEGVAQPVERVTVAAALQAQLVERQAQLTQIDAELKAATALAAEANKRYFQFEHDIVYTNEPAKVVYQEMKALEKQLVDKRQELKELVMKLPEMREMIKDRQDLFEAQRKLRERQRILQGEIDELKQKGTNF